MRNVHNEQRWWDDTIKEPTNEELTAEVIARKSARLFTGVTAKDWEDGRYSHIVIYKP